MTSIYVYDANKTDKKQLTELFVNIKRDVVFIDEPLSLKNVNEDAEVIAVFLTSEVTGELLRKMSNLRLIACRSTGYDNIDLTTATDRGIKVVNVPTYGDHTVAEYAFSLLLMVVRKLPAVLSAVEKGESGHESFVGMDLAGKTLGVIGTGHIGQRVLEIGKGFGMKLLAYDPFQKDDVAEKLGFQYDTLENVLSASDVISLHVPMVASNEHLIDTEKLSLMKPTAILVNTARGELVDTTALIDALENNKLGGAALDVVEGEKVLAVREELAMLRTHLVPQDQLLKTVEIDVLTKMPNVILTNHNAFNTVEAIQRINAETVDNITAYFNGKIQNEVKPGSATIGKLIVVRHGESEWNAMGVWTGSRDVHLSEKGFREAGLLGRNLAGTHIDQAYASEQIRALETLEGILDASQQFDVPFERSKTLNERDYGDYTGKNKWQMRELLGEEAFEKIRREWSCPVPNGETLQMVYGRVVPFYRHVIVPKLLEGKNVLIVSHGNAIRALIKYVESISDTNISQVEMLIGDILIYDIDPSGHMVDKEIKKIQTPSYPDKAASK